MAKKQWPKRIYDKIAHLSELGNQFVDQGDDNAALQKYKEAWELIPDDKVNWEASTWLLAVIGFYRRDILSATKLRKSSESLSPSRTMSKRVR
jgi:hypothetical protein